MFSYSLFRSGAAYKFYGKAVCFRLVVFNEKGRGGGIKQGKRRGFAVKRTET
jgi:hypothetical protein